MLLQLKEISLDFLKKLKLLKTNNQSEEDVDDEPIESPGSTNEIEQDNLEDLGENSSSDSSLEDINLEMDDNLVPSGNN